MADHCSLSSVSKVTCSVCLEVYTDPRVLPCLHVYCLECIKGLIKDSSVTCPQCRAKTHHDTGNDLDCFPVDLSILPKLEEAKKNSGSEKNICEFCTTGDIAIGYCGECREYLCQYCWDVHKRSKMFLKHKVLFAKEVSLSKAPAVIRQPAICVHHPEYKIEVYCRTCVSLVCCKCILGLGHKGHENVLIEEANEEVKEKIQSLSVDALLKESRFEFYTKLVENFEAIALSEQENFRCKVKAFTEDLMILLEEVFTEDNKKIWAAKNDLQMILSQIKTSQSFSVHIQEKIGDKQYLSLANQVLRCLVKIDSADVASSFEKIWGINGTSLSFKEKLDAIIDPKKLHLVKVTEAEENEDNDDMKDREIRKESDDTHIYVTTKPVKMFEYIGERIKAHAILEQPFAEATKWSCTCITDPECSPSAEAVDNHKIEVEFCPADEGTFLFHLSPERNESFIVEFEVELEERPWWK